MLDQFSRHLFRDSPVAFAQDNMAVALAQEAIGQMGCANTTPSALYFEIKHKVIINRVGHYPHRNQVLGRVSTIEEMTFLQEPNSSF